MRDIYWNTTRRKLDNRQPSITRSLECNGLTYSTTYSYFPDCNLAEIFISNAKDSAIVCSIALQHGVGFDTRRALLRDPRGKASSPLGVALDLIAEMEDGQ
jgi:hypothetical protein